jgi:hypothetical protein
VVSQMCSTSWSFCRSSDAVGIPRIALSRRTPSPSRDLDDRSSFDDACQWARTYRLTLMVLPSGAKLGAKGESTPRSSSRILAVALGRRWGRAEATGPEPSMPRDDKNFKRRVRARMTLSLLAAVVLVIVAPCGDGAR